MPAKLRITARVVIDARTAAIAHLAEKPARPYREILRERIVATKLHTGRTTQTFQKFCRPHGGFEIIGEDGTVTT